MEKALKRKLEIFAIKMRMAALNSIYCAKSGHPGGSFGICEVLSYLYNIEMNVYPENPKFEDRDRFVLSKGHAAPALYAALALKGFFPLKELEFLRKPNSYLQGHPNMNSVPGVDMSTGSLGQGISAACGMAYGAKALKKDFRVYTILGDGELEEGQVWEAAMFAGNHKLDNLVAFVDHNGLQIDGSIEDINSAMPIDEKFKAFKWNVIKIDGHNFDEIESALNQAKNIKEKPTCIVMETVKGKGISFMENKVSWHGVAPNDEQFSLAMAELKKTLEELEA